MESQNFAIAAPEMRPAIRLNETDMSEMPGVSMGFFAVTSSADALQILEIQS